MKKVNELSFVFLGAGFSIARLVDANYVEAIGGVVVGFIAWTIYKLIKKCSPRKCVTDQFNKKVWFYFMLNRILPGYTFTK